MIDGVRGQHPDYVFVYRSERVGTMHNTAWQSARRSAQLPQVRVHDLKHTYARRVRAAGVSFEDRQDLLGHRSGRITTHYSAAEVGVVVGSSRTGVRRRIPQNSRTRDAEAASACQETGKRLK